MTPPPDLATPVAVWRVWDVWSVGGRPELMSPVRMSPWPAREATAATCLRSCGRTASLACSCGLYGCTDLGAIAPQWSAGRVLGSTALWGRVCEHTGGYRGEFGYPLVLFVHVGLRDPRMERLLRVAFEGLDDPPEMPPADEHLVRRLADAYAVPVHGVEHPELVRTPARAVEAVSRESARGQAARHLGDSRAHDRLDTAVGNLLRAWGASVDG